MKKMNNKLSLMSVDEKKFSVLVFVLLIFTVVICWKYILIGYVAEGIVTIYLTLVGAIAGINIAKDVAHEVSQAKVERARIEFQDLDGDGIDDREQGYEDPYTDMEKGNDKNV